MHYLPADLENVIRGTEDHVLSERRSPAPARRQGAQEKSLSVRFSRPSSRQNELPPISPMNDVL